jgi:hypothetical protein
MNRTRIAVGVALASVLALAGAAVAVATVKLPAPGSSSQVKQLVAASSKITKLSSSVKKELASAANDAPGVLYPKTANGCTTLTACVFGDTTSHQVLVALGDSHAQMWIPALIRIGVAHKLRVVLLYLAQCPAASLDVWAQFGNKPYTQCSTDRSTWITDLNGLKPKVVVLAERTYGVYSAASGGTATFTDAQWEAGLEATITGLAPSKAKVVVLGDIVTLQGSPEACLASNPTNVQACSVPDPNPSRPNHEPAEQTAAKAEGSLFVNPGPWLCTTTCSVVIGSFIAYYDEFHISSQYAAYLSGVLQTALKKVL